MEKGFNAIENKTFQPVKDGPIELPPLPYPENALEPVISRETLKCHYEKHHAGYVEKTNKFLQQSNLKGMPLEEIIRQASGPLLNNAAQVWNHTFFWNCMTPEGKTLKGGPLMDTIEQVFGSFDEFKTKFCKEAEDLFGSGYVWLVRDDQGGLKIDSRHNADSPLRDGLTPLLNLDVWEHAYYLDYKNERKKFVAKFFGIINWDFVTTNFESAMTRH